MAEKTGLKIIYNIGKKTFFQALDYRPNRRTVEQDQETHRRAHRRHRGAPFVALILHLDHTIETPEQTLGPEH